MLSWLMYGNVCMLILILLIAMPAYSVVVLLCCSSDDGIGRRVSGCPGHPRWHIHRYLTSLPVLSYISLLFHIPRPYCLMEWLLSSNGTYIAPLLYQDDVQQEDDDDATTSTTTNSLNNASTGSIDKYTHARDEALAWLTHRGISDVTEVLGVVCESDVGLRTAEEFAASLQLPTANPRCEVLIYPLYISWILY